MDSTPWPFSALAICVHMRGRAFVISLVSASSVSAVTKEPSSKHLDMGETTLPTSSGCSRMKTRASSSTLVACCGEVMLKTTNRRE